MKKYFLCAAVIAVTFITSIFAQQPASPSFGKLLFTYYNVKNALVSSNSLNVKNYAAELQKVIVDIDTKTLIPSDLSAFKLFKEKIIDGAKAVFESKNLAEQREHFSDLSNQIIQLAKAIKLSDEKIYENYCPMKKSYWLSAEAAIKNPYYGKAMLSCGNVVETLNK